MARLTDVRFVKSTEEVFRALANRGCGPLVDLALAAAKHSLPIVMRSTLFEALAVRTRDALVKCPENVDGLSIFRLQVSNHRIDFEKALVVGFCITRMQGPIVGRMNFSEVLS